MASNNKEIELEDGKQLFRKVRHVHSAADLKVRLGLHPNLLPLQAVTYPVLLSMKRLAVFLTSLLDEMLINLRVNPALNSTGSHWFS